MKITLTLTHEFDTAEQAAAFALKLEPLTRELEAAPPTLRAPSAAEAAAIEAPAKSHFDEVRENAETVNKSLAEKVEEAQEEVKRRTRRTKAEIEAARAEEAAKAAAPAPSAPAPTPAPAPAVDDFDIDFAAPAPAAPAKVSDADFRIAFTHFSKVVTDWRDVLPKLLADLGAERMSALPETKRPDALARMSKHLAAANLPALPVAA